MLVFVRLGYGCLCEVGRKVGRQVGKQVGTHQEVDIEESEICKSLEKPFRCGVTDLRNLNPGNSNYSKCIRREINYKDNEPIRR